jgi:hypothetical protein
MLAIAGALGLCYLWFAAFFYIPFTDRDKPVRAALVKASGVVADCTLGLVASVLVTALLWCICTPPSKRPSFGWLVLYLVLMIGFGIVLPPFGI